MKIRTLLLMAAISSPFTALAGETPAPADAEVYFVNLKNNDEVTSPFKVIFGLSGMGIAPAGVEAENTGHHHLLVNRPPLGEGEDGKDEFDYGLPADENHVHFGKGQTETTLDLPKGKHTLQMVLGDWSHVPHDNPVVSEVIQIMVK